MKHAVITGASQGLGRALLDAFLARGYAVSFCARRAERIRGIEHELAAQDHAARVHGCVADIANRDELEALSQSAIDKFGPVSIWINNAGYARGGSTFADLPDVEFEQMLHGNLLGTALACQTALRGMRSHGSGALYNILGAGADGKLVPGMLGYATTKNALRYLTLGLAAEHTDTGLVVGGISPGLVLTEAIAREFARVPPAARAARIARLDLIAELPATSANWIADCSIANKSNGAIFT